MFNYADDNIAGTSADTIDSLCRSLQRIAGDMLSWFDLNYMTANPKKFLFLWDDTSTLTIPPGVRESCQVTGSTI